MKVALRAFGTEPSKNEIKRLTGMLEYEEKDQDNKNLLDPQDFEQLMALKMGSRETQEEIEKAFLLFDKDRTNKISLDNLREISAELGFKMTDDELMDMLIEANPQNDSGNVIDI